MADTTQTEQQAPVTGTLKFGVEGLSNPTPMWATWCFRVEFILTKMLAFWLASTHNINLEHMQETLLIITTVDFGVWTLARFLGIKKADLEG